jgi:predicted DNA-binding transcriptional regulator YafY
MDARQPSLRDLASQLEEVGRAHPCWSQVHEIVRCATDHICAVARANELSLREAQPTQVVEFSYTNWKGQHARRRARLLYPPRFGTSDWYREPCWLVMAMDLDKGEPREFKLDNMTDVRAVDR